jgi:hypothetical protein
MHDPEAIDRAEGCSPPWSDAHREQDSLAKSVAAALRPPAFQLERRQPIAIQDSSPQTTTSTPMKIA